MRSLLRLTPSALLIGALAVPSAGAITLDTTLEQPKETSLKQRTNPSQQGTLPLLIATTQAFEARALEQERDIGTVLAAANTQNSGDASSPQQSVGKKPEEHEPAQSTFSSSSGVSVTKKRGGIYIEPTLGFVHSSSSRVAVEGFSIIPSIIVGLINIQEVRRDTLTAALNFRYALSNRLELGLRVPYLQREEDIRERDLLTATEDAALVSSSGSGLGDIEVSAHYKLTPFTEPGPYYTANLRVKTTTGDGPFDVPRRIVYADDGVRIVGEFFLEQPTGSGFYTIEPSLSVAYPTDPAVLYGSLGYMWNLSHDSKTANGRIDPGDAINLSFGMGFAINEAVSFNLGYSHSVVLRSKIEFSNNANDFNRFHVGSLKFGVNIRLDSTRSANVNIAIGATTDAPDMQLSVGLPFSF